MPSVDESVQGPTTPLADALHGGVAAISYDQTILFNLYRRVVLPLDGYVFWVKDGDESFVAKGSLHYITDSQQLEESSSSRNRVVFTAVEPVQNLNAIDPQVMFLGRFDGPQPGDTPPTDSTEIRFSFSSRSSHYQQAGLWHYNGVAVYQSMDTQIIDDPKELLNHPLIVSNSLPFWLSLTGYNPPWPVPVPMPAIKFYPSFLLPDNLSPPYVAVHIEPAQTEAWQTMPHLGPETEQDQLVRDRVQLTLYGCTNKMAKDILYAILQYSFDTERFGILNIPAVRDEKEAQVELHTLAQKKRITFEVSYTQGTVRTVARQLIESAIVTVQVGDETLFP